MISEIGRFKNIDKKGYNCSRILDFRIKGVGNPLNGYFQNPGKEDILKIVSILSLAQSHNPRFFKCACEMVGPKAPTRWGEAY